MSTKLSTQYHPFLFLLLMLCAMAELGLGVFLIVTGYEHEYWPSSRYRALLILFLFDAAWTIFFSSAYLLYCLEGGRRLLADIASSVIWLIMTTTLWGAAAGLWHNTRTGGDCTGQPAISECRETLTIEGLGWAQFSLSALTMLSTIAWMQESRWKRRLDEVLEMPV
uniref:MARVEL domain-containing protein n=2 Tax=Schizophyllum commune (strain H4-8 / FGSC 9210) TaxID=578458 RepID=D8PPV2_SCHCM